MPCSLACTTASVFAEVFNEKYNKFFEMYNELNTLDDETYNNELVYETPVADTFMFTHTPSSDVTIVPYNYSLFLSLSSNVTVSVVSQILNYGNTTINFIINETTMVASAIACNKQNFTTVLIQYLRAVSSGIWNYGSNRMLGEKGFDRIQWIAQPDNELDYQIKCHYRDTIVKIRQEEARSIVDLFGPFGKYHVMNCDGDIDKLNKYKVGLMVLVVVVALCIIKMIIAHIIRLLNSTPRSTTSVEAQLALYSTPSSTSAESEPAAHDDLRDEHIAELLQSYEQTYSFRCHTIEGPKIKIPTLEDSEAVYDKVWATYRQTPTVMQRTDSNHSQQTLVINNHTLVLPEIMTPTEAEYVTMFQQIYKEKRQTTHAEYPEKTLKHYVSVLAFHAFEVQYYEKMQHRVTLIEEFGRMVDFEIAEKKRQDIQAAIDIFRNLD